MKSQTDPKERRLHIWLLVPLFCLGITLQLWGYYSNSDLPISRTWISSIILGLGTLLSLLIGYFIWSLESGRDYLRKEIKRRSEELVEKERETVLAVARSVAAKQRQFELEEAYQKLQEAQEQLVQSEKLASIGRVLAGVVHEVNSPLVTIQGYVRQIREVLKDPETLSSLNVIERQAVRAHSLVQDLLFFMRRQKINPLGLDPCKLADEVLEACAPECRRAGVKVEKRYADFLPKFVADPDQIRRVLVNLVINAVQALEEQHSTERKIILQILPAEKSVQFFVTDTGCGIPKANLKKIFEPFFTTKPAGKGTGLGLSLSAGIIQAHGGTLSVESEEGKGTTIVVDLLLETPSTSRVKESGGMVQDGEIVKILVVDDDPQILDFLSRLLPSWGYGFLAASSAKEAMHLLRLRPREFGAVILDILLPDQNGFDTAREILADPLFRGLPLIFCSGHDSPEMDQKALALGLAVPFKKPFQFDRLKKQLDLLTGRSNGSALPPIV